MYCSRKTIAALLMLILVSTALLSGAAAPERQVIVEFRPGTAAVEKDITGKALGLSWISDLSIVNARSVRMPEARMEALLKNPNVLAVHEDVVVNAMGKPSKPPVPQAPQVTPWGITEIKASDVNLDGRMIKVGVIDTGIDSTHPDLSGMVKGGINFINSRKSAMDDNGHGTHVSGTIAAVDNSIGVVGVSQHIELYSLKVLNASGSGYLSDIIEALQWATGMNGGTRLDVVNMSLGTDSDAPLFRSAIDAVASDGLIMVAAAGNDGTDVDYPAAYPGVMAIAAVDIGHNAAYFTSPGTEVDLAAPGVDVYSTVPGGKYASYNGTSMATPHVTGTVALILESHGPGALTYNMILEHLTETAAPLDGGENTVGAGLVDALAAVNYSK